MAELKFDRTKIRPSLGVTDATPAVIEVKKPKSDYSRSVKDLKNTLSPFERYKANNKDNRGVALGLTADKVSSIATALTHGHHPDFAAAGAGVSPKTLTSWLLRGKKDFDRLCLLEEQGTELRDEHYSLFYHLFVKVQEGLFDVQDRSLMSINTAAMAGDWKAAAHLLERRFPKQWGRKTETKIESHSKVEAIVRAVVIAPKRVSDDAEWDNIVGEYKAGKLKHVPHVTALPGSSVNEQPEVDALPEPASFDEIFES